MKKIFIYFVFVIILSLLYFISHPKPTTELKYVPRIVPTPTSIPVVSIGLVGDLGLGRFITSTARSKNDYNYSFSSISSWLGQNDFTLANLESPIIKNCPQGLTGTFTFCGDDKFIPVLEKYNFVLNLNNNHILNYGQTGLNQTQTLLNNIPNFYDNFLTKTINGVSFGFLGFDYITYPTLDKNEILNKIKQYNFRVDYLIISIHWGNEYLPKAEAWRVTLAHDMVDAGADIIHGHHPHVWQDYEVYQDKLIFYSFGNFIFDQSWSWETSHSQIAIVTLSKNKIDNIRLSPIEIKNNSKPQLTDN
ncbi:MAG: CapA family protein [Candidatus Shapirobacteria bacterium]